MFTCLAKTREVSVLQRLIGTIHHNLVYIMGIENSEGVGVGSTIGRTRARVSGAETAGPPTQAKIVSMRYRLIDELVDDQHRQRQTGKTVHLCTQESRGVDKRPIGAMGAGGGWLHVPWEVRSFVRGFSCYLELVQLDRNKLTK